MRALVTIVALVCVMAGVGLAYAAQSAGAASMSDATAGASFSAQLRPGASVTIERQCGAHYFTEYQAYRSNGGALGDQRWTEQHTLVWWRGRHGRVTFDGITFKNGTRAPVIVAGWCG